MLFKSVPKRTGPQGQKWWYNSIWKWKKYIKIRSNWKMAIKIPWALQYCKFVPNIPQKQVNTGGTKATNLHLYILDQIEKKQSISQEPFIIVVLYQNEPKEHVQKIRSIQ